jgi:rSAM/selenodomain-associated transferase 1
MGSSALPEEIRIAVFAKAPVPGEVKTRLNALLGPDGAAALHAGLVRHALSVATASGVGQVELHYAPDTRDAFFARCAERFHVSLVPQQGADLGERMRRAFEGAFAARSALLVIGSDCPALGASELRTAATALREKGAVIIPAEDGGYVLIGLAAPVEGLFEGVDWGTERVLRQTRARFAEAKTQCVELPTLWDLDRPEDYARLSREGLLDTVLS